MEPFKFFKDALLTYCELDYQSWKILKSLFTRKHITPKECIAVEGENARNFGFVVGGCLRMYNLTRDGKELTKHFFLPGSFIASAIKPEQKSTVTIQALTDCCLLITDYRKMDELADKNPVINKFKMNLISEFVQMKQERENNYLSLDARARYHLFLKKFPHLIDQIPHYHIASYLGVSPTQLSRVRKKIS